MSSLFIVWQHVDDKHLRVIHLHNLFSVLILNSLSNSSDIKSFNSLHSLSSGCAHVFTATVNMPKIQFALCHISRDSIRRGNTWHLRRPKYLCRKCTWNFSFGGRFAELFAKERLQCRWCPLNRIDISTNAVTNTGGFLRGERLNFHLSIEGKINQTISCIPYQQEVILQ